MELARRTGLHHQTIRRYEDGRREPTALGAARIAAALGIDHRDLYDTRADDDEKHQAA